MSSDTGPYREAASPDAHGRRLVPLDRVASARQATLMRDAATDLASKLSKHASEIAVRARELAWDWVIMPNNEAIPVSIGRRRLSWLHSSTTPAHGSDRARLSVGVGRRRDHVGGA